MRPRAPGRRPPRSSPVSPVGPPPLPSPFSWEDWAQKDRLFLTSPSAIHPWPPSCHLCDSFTAPCEVIFCPPPGRSHGNRHERLTQRWELSGCLSGRGAASLRLPPARPARDPCAAPAAPARRRGGRGGARGPPCPPRASVQGAPPVVSCSLALPCSRVQESSPGPQVPVWLLCLAAP